MQDPLSKNSCAYRMIKEKFPQYDDFTIYYFEGSYYDRAYTSYYANGKEIYREQHCYYG